MGLLEFLFSRTPPVRPCDHGAVAHIIQQGWSDNAAAARTTCRFAAGAAGGNHAMLR